jgi:bifunctional UDP-N-acetylglucosamine pyrophosphorylase/glucosamine-1-phosphate N-acetyltransferase
VRRGATLGAGTTLTKDAPANQLTISRAKQVSLQWQRPVKQEKKSATKKVTIKKSVSKKLTTKKPAKKAMKTASKAVARGKK